MFQKLSVFLSHAHEDKPFARELAKRLTASGFVIWFDEDRLLPGQDWDLEIRKAVRKSHVVIVLLSDRSISKTGYFQKEISLAIDTAQCHPEGAIYLIPARLTDCAIPDRLSRWHAVPLYESQGFDRLREALVSRAVSLALWEQPDNSEGAAERDGKRIASLLGELQKNTASFDELFDELNRSVESLEKSPSNDQVLGACMSSRAMLAHALASAVNGTFQFRRIDQLSDIFDRLGRSLPPTSNDSKTQSYIESIKHRQRSLRALKGMRRYNRGR